MYMWRRTCGGELPHATELELSRVNKFGDKPKEEKKKNPWQGLHSWKTCFVIKCIGELSLIKASVRV